MEKKQTEAEKRKEKWVKDRKKAYGENTMSHGSMTIPSEYIRFLWAFNIQEDRLTPREYTVLLGLMDANKFEREMEHDPAYISQEELGRRLGISQVAISQVYKKLKGKRFECPLCKKYTRKGYIDVVEVEPENGKLRADHTWTDGFKEIVNHLAGHYNGYIETHNYHGKDEFLQDRDTLIEDSIPEWRKQLGCREPKGDF